MRSTARRVAFAALAAVLGLGVGLATLDRVAPEHRDPTAAISTIEDAHASTPRAPQIPVRGIMPAAIFAGLLLAAAFAAACTLHGVGYPARLLPGRGPAPRAPTAR